MIHDRVLKLVLAACLLAICGHAAATSQSTSEPLPITAIWHIQQVPLRFRSERIYYSCSTLKEKITTILSAVGAREDLVVNLPCRSNVMTNNAFLSITLAIPIEATHENVIAATTYSPQAQLVARLNKIQLPAANDLERFTAERRPLALNKERRLRLDGSDCDLLRSVALQVFPQLGVRLDQRTFNCPAATVTRSLPQLRVVTLVAVPGVVPVAYTNEEAKPQ